MRKRRSRVALDRPLEKLAGILIVFGGDHANVLNAENFTGTDPSPWSRWLRGWTSEENRHGDLLNAYLRLTGRVDMRSIELTVTSWPASSTNDTGSDATVLPTGSEGVLENKIIER